MHFVCVCKAHNIFIMAYHNNEIFNQFVWQLNVLMQNKKFLNLVKWSSLLVNFRRKMVRKTSLHHCEG